ncbi:ATP-binding protein [Paraburkholderia phymatum]|uniref:ATP-binding protein n=1 Tax=Paraburkholderia phymatum TaxID=148447 RepID=UPI003173FE0A
MCLRRDVTVIVRDNGIGIAPDMLPRVFDFFSQPPSARMRAEGGLRHGLSVVRYPVNACAG